MLVIKLNCPTICINIKLLLICIVFFNTINTTVSKFKTDNIFEFHNKLALLQTINYPRKKKLINIDSLQRTDRVFFVRIEQHNQDYSGILEIDVTWLQFASNKDLNFIDQSILNKTYKLIKSSKQKIIASIFYSRLKK